MNKIRIAIIYYQGMSLIDAGTFCEVLQTLETRTEGRVCVETCALQASTPSQGSSFTADQIKPDLSAFDWLVLPGTALLDQALANNDLLTWLAGAKDTRLAAVGNARTILSTAGLVPAAEATSIQNQMEADRLVSASSSRDALTLAVRLCALLAGGEVASDVEQSMGLRPPQTARRGLVTRSTRETSVKVNLDLDGSGKYDIHTGVPFLDHMLTQIAVHGLFDLQIEAEGDIHIDPHHTMEDVGLSLGKAFREALGNKAGIYRMASFSVPMDESLATVTLDFSGRPYAVLNIQWNAPYVVTNIPASLFEHFFESFAFEARCNLHIQVPYGRDDHHKAEAAFKALARALNAATRIDPRRAGSVPSSKGVLM